MKQLLNNSPALHGTAGGTVAGLLINIGSGDLQRTMIMATLGSVVSFFVSLGLKLLVVKWRKRG